MPFTQVANKKSIECFASIGLLLLPIATAWLFLPQLANAFDIKHHISIIGTLVFFIAFILAHGNSSFAIPKGLIGIGLLIWLLAVFISAASAENSFFSLKMLFEVMVFLLVALAVFNLRYWEHYQHKLEVGIMVAGLGVAVFALKQQFLPTLLDPGFHALGKLKIYSTLGNSNLAALIILAAIPLVIWRALRGQAALRMAYLIGLMVLLAGLLVTQARHAWIAIGITSLLALFWLGSNTLRKIASAGLLLISLVVITLLYWVDLPPALAHSIKGREFIWLTALEMLQAHPMLGIGLGQFGIHHLTYQSELFASGEYNAFFDNAAVISEAHNDFLNWGAMTGILGLCGYTMMCVTTLWQGWHSAKLKERAPHIYLTFVSYMIAMFFIALTAYTATALFFFLLLGMVWASSDLVGIKFQKNKYVNFVGVACLVTLLAIESHLTWREVRGGLLEAKGDRLMEQHDLWLASQSYQEALAWNPRRGELRKKYASTLFLAGDLPLALAELQSAKSDSGDLGIYLLEGEILTRLGATDRAISAYRKISEAFPNLISAHFILGQLYQLQGKPEKAKDEFRLVLRIDPSPFNLNRTEEKTALQKRLVRDYFEKPPPAQ